MYLNEASDVLAISCSYNPINTMSPVLWWSVWFRWNVQMVPISLDYTVTERWRVDRTLGKIANVCCCLLRVNSNCFWSLVDWDRKEHICCKINGKINWDGKEHICKIKINFWIAIVPTVEQAYNNLNRNMFKVLENSDCCLAYLQMAYTMYVQVVHTSFVIGIVVSRESAQVATLSRKSRVTDAW